MPHSRAERDAWRRLAALADLATPYVRRQVERALLRLQRAASLARIERALATRDAFAIHQVSAALPYELRAAVRMLDDVFARSVRIGASMLPFEARPPVSIGFNAVNSFSVRAARTESATMVTNVTAETRQAISTVVTRSFAEGIPPREAARMIQPLIGLTERQALAVVRKQAALVRDGFTTAQAVARTREYARKLLASRALSIARTETISMSTRGSVASWRDAVQRGLLSPRARKVWIVTPYDRLCRRCRAMDGALALLGDMFLTMRERSFGPPLHPRCRCAVGLDPGVPVRRRAA